MAQSRRLRKVQICPVETLDRYVIDWFDSGPIADLRVSRDRSRHPAGLRPPAPLVLLTLTWALIAALLLAVLGLIFKQPRARAAAWVRTVATKVRMRLYSSIAKTWIARWTEWPPSWHSVDVTKRVIRTLHTR